MDDAPPPAACRLCGTALPDGAERCSSCGLAVATDISGAALRRLAAGVAVIYLFTAIVLILTR
jgi:predicted nucleic acid-binding Zn ribbon protein